MSALALEAPVSISVNSVSRRLAFRLSPSLSILSYLRALLGARTLIFGYVRDLMTSLLLAAFEHLNFD